METFSKNISLEKVMDTTTVEELKASALSLGAKRKVFTLPTEEEANALMKLVEESRKLKFLAKYDAKVTRGDGSSIHVGGNEWRMKALAELFGFDENVLNILEYNASEILNEAGSSQLLIGLEQVKLLREINNALNRLVAHQEVSGNTVSKGLDNIQRQSGSV